MQHYFLHCTSESNLLSNCRGAHVQQSFLKIILSGQPYFKIFTPDGAANFVFDNLNLLPFFPPICPSQHIAFYSHFPIVVCMQRCERASNYKSVRSGQLC